MFKRTISLMLTIVMVMAIAVVGTVNGSAVTKPKAPTSVEYSSDYAIDEHFLSFKSSSKVDGFNIRIVRDDGEKLWYATLYFWTCNYDDYFYKDGDKYIIQSPMPTTDGSLHTLQIRAFKVPKKYYNTHSITGPNLLTNLTRSPGKSATYSNWSKSIYMASGVDSLKATRVNNGNNLKISWKKIPKATKYKLSISSIDKKNINMEYIVNGTSKTIGKISGVSFKKAKKILVSVVPIAVNNTKVYSPAFKYLSVAIK